jgi:Repeat of Unknown Function (DUF347)
MRATTGLTCVRRVRCYHIRIARPGAAPGSLSCAAVLFWTAFVLARPLGATVGDFHDKPFAQGGLDVSRPLASAIIAAFIVVCLLVFPQHAAAAAAPRIARASER